MVKLDVQLPFSRWDYKISGIYRILFDTGEFYIGASSNLRSRASSWMHMCECPHRFKDVDYNEYGDNVVARIKAGGNAILSIVELCSVDDLMDREAEYLEKYKADPKMVSKSECSWKSVLQYKRDGHFIKRHASIKAAARYNNTTSWRIQEVLDGTRNTHKDMVFVYESAYNDRRKEIIKERWKFKLPKKTKSLKIGQYDQNGNLIKTYDTYNDAARSVNRCSSTIKQALAGKQSTSGGYKWGFIEDGGNSI